MVIVINFLRDYLMPSFGDVTPDGPVQQRCLFQYANSDIQVYKFYKIHFIGLT